MANQAMGVYVKTRIIPEDELRKLPTNLTNKVFELPFNSNTLASSQNTTNPGTMTGRRDATEPILGNIDNSGNITLPLDTEACGYLFAMAFGKPTTKGTTVSDGVKAPYTHVFKPKTQQPSFAVEKVFNNGIFALSKGVKVSKMSFSFGGDGELTVSADLMGCDEELNDRETGTGAKAVKINRLNNFQASMFIDGQEVSIVTELSLDIDFGLDGEGYAIGGKGYRGRINEGIITPSGTLKAFFDDKSLVDRAINSTITSIQVKLTKGTDSLIIDLPECMFARKTPAIDGAKGIVQELSYNAFFKENSDNSCVKITLTNGTADYNAFTI